MQKTIRVKEGFENFYKERALYQTIDEVKFFKRLETLGYTDLTDDEDAPDFFDDDDFYFQISTSKKPDQPCYTINFIINEQPEGRGFRLVYSKTLKLQKTKATLDDLLTFISEAIDHLPTYATIDED